MILNADQLRDTADRYQSRRVERERNTELIRQNRLLEVDTPERVAKFLARRGYSDNEIRVILGSRSEGALATKRVEGVRGPQRFERMMGINDLIGVAFLEVGLSVARSVGRVWVDVSGGRPAGYGSGCMVSPTLFLTNHHVLGDIYAARNSMVEFDYQVGANGEVATSCTFKCDPDTFHYADKHLDYAFVALKAQGSTKRALAEFGWNNLYEEEGKAILGQWINIIQHPNGEPKQLGIRENNLIDLLEEYLHYKTDTAPGSSGAPIYNDRWEVIGIHHSGVWRTNDAGRPMAVDGSVWTEDMGEHRIDWIANEGVRISRIIKHLRTTDMPPEHVRLVEQMLSNEVRAPLAVNRPAVSQNATSEDSTSTQHVMASDGSVNITIPLHISVRLGDQASQGGSKQINVSAGGTVSARTAQPDTPEATLQKAREALLGKPGVIDVRLGYKFKDGWITKERAIVVTVRERKSAAALREAAVEALPSQLGGLPVDITSPTIEQLVEEHQGPFDLEAMRLGEVSREEITYVPPEDEMLDKVTAKMRVVAHVSPDTGWAQLGPFLELTKKSLTIAMYDFGAPHIVDAIAALNSSKFKDLTLVIQPGESVGEGTKEDDLTDQEVVDRFTDAFGNKFNHAWVKIGKKNGWVSSSYHIKVAVRDSEAFWLSSGNWQSSNQPTVDPFADNPPKRTHLTKYNREWHVIVEHAGLAKAFEHYIRHDLTNNQAGPEEVLRLPELLVPGVFFMPSAEEKAKPFKYFQPFEDDREFTVQPLLTPDNYYKHVLKLIKSAKHELLIQNQTFNAPKEDQKALREILDAIMERQAAGVDVKVIFRVLMASNARKTLEGLQDYGFDTSIIRLQKNCHTKGMVVDRKRVMLGSQNISNDGVSVNRDASLIFFDEPLANYFGDLFDHDWNALAKASIGSEATHLEMATASKNGTPEGMIRLTAKEYMEMLA